VILNRWFDVCPMGHFKPVNTIFNWGCVWSVENTYDVRIEF